MKNILISGIIKSKRIISSGILDTLIIIFIFLNNAYFEVFIIPQNFLFNFILILRITSIILSSVLLWKLKKVSLTIKLGIIFAIALSPLIGGLILFLLLLNFVYKEKD